jgi:hypothetical protein
MCACAELGLREFNNNTSTNTTTPNIEPNKIDTTPNTHHPTSPMEVEPPMPATAKTTKTWASVAAQSITTQVKKTHRTQKNQVETTPQHLTITTTHVKAQRDYKGKKTQENKDTPPTPANREKSMGPQHHHTQTTTRTNFKSDSEP